MIDLQILIVSFIDLIGWCLASFYPMKFLSLKNKQIKTLFAFMSVIFLKKYFSYEISQLN